MEWLVLSHPQGTCYLDLRGKRSRRWHVLRPRAGSGISVIDEKKDPMTAAARTPRVSICPLPPDKNQVANMTPFCNVLRVAD